MRAVFIVLLCLFTLPALAVDYERAITPGGISFVHVENRSVPILSIEVALPGGGAYDEAEQAGRARFASGLLNEGAGPYDALAFQGLMDNFGVSIGADAGRDFIGISMNTLSANKAEAFELLRLAVQEPRFDETAVERVRAQMLSLIRRGRESPGSIASDALFASLFPGHGYGRPVNGMEETISALTRDDLKAWTEARFLKNHMLVVTIGAASKAEVAKLIDHAFGAWPDGAAPVLPAAAVQAGPSLEIIEKAQPQSVIVFAAPGILRDDPDFIAAFVMNHILGGGGFSSRLMEEVREKRGLAYGVSTGFYPYKQAGIYYGQVATSNETAGQAMDLIRAELRDVAENGVTEAQLSDAKTYLTGAYPLRFNSNAKIAGQMIGLMQQGVGLDYIEKRNGMIEAVSMDDIRRVATRLLHADALKIVAVGQPEALE